MRWLFLPILFTLFFSSLVFAEGSPIDTAEGVVVKVIDGGKINVNSEGMILKIRLYGIDAPEKKKISLKTGEVNKAGQPFGEESWKALESKVYHQKVQLEIIDIDRYGRMVAIVWLRGREINKEMVAEGWAWAYRKYIHDPYTSEYINAEEKARKEKRGLWQQHKPQPPWEFRQIQKLLMQLHSSNSFKRFNNKVSQG